MTIKLDCDKLERDSKDFMIAILRGSNIGAADLRLLETRTQLASVLVAFSNQLAYELQKANQSKV
jgi:hypothetical protein